MVGGNIIVKLPLFASLITQFLSSHFTAAAATTKIQSPTTNLAQSQGIVGAMNKEHIISYLKMCSNSTQLECIYACIVKNSLNQDCFMINQFVSACSVFNKMDYAIRAFTQMDDPNVFVYNAVIRACVCCASPVQALRFYLNMLSAKVAPTSYTFSSVIKGCALVAELRIGEAVNGHVWKFGFKSHVYVQTALIDFYSSVGQIFDARQVFDEMTERDVFAWSSMVSVHSRAGDLVFAKKLFDDIPERNFASWNSLINGYARIKNVGSAEVLFSKMPQKDLISWTTMISCYSQNKLYQRALATFNQMTAQGIIPNEVTMATAIQPVPSWGT